MWAVRVDVVRGVAILDGILYVVCEMSPDIHVFDTATYKRLSDIKVLNMDDPNSIGSRRTLPRAGPLTNGTYSSRDIMIVMFNPLLLNMDDPNDIVACNTSKLLFVADCRTDKPGCVGCLWKVSPSGTVTRWLLSGGLSPYSLSIRNGRILVTPTNAKL